MKKTNNKVIDKSIVIPFILITSLFALWGFANDITNPMVKAFSDVLDMTNFQGSLVQFAFYGGYFAMAFPAALFIKKYSYKAGVLLGLGLYATGALLFIPATMLEIFGPFLIAYFILTCGLSFLETSCNPYIMSMGDEETATRRLNLSQAFNPIGSLMGMFVAQKLILAKITPDNDIANNLGIIRDPYVFIGLVVLAMFVVIAMVKMPKKQGKDHNLHIKETINRLLKTPKYYEGVITQCFYVGAQIMCWTFVIHYAERIGIDKATAQNYNIGAMLLFLFSRFICTFLLKYINSGKLLMILAVGGIGLTLGTIFIQGMTGLYCLVGISACMSLMFPTIYGIALRGLGEDAKFGAAGLIMAILGGSVMPPLQGAIIDMGIVDLGLFKLPAENASFVLPLICFVVITIFGYRTFKIHLKNK